MNPQQQYGAVFDTISVCLSKGLGCPVGSVLIGNEGIMEKALEYVKCWVVVCVRLEFWLQLDCMH